VNCRCAACFSPGSRLSALCVSVLNLWVLHVWCLPVLDQGSAAASRQLTSCWLRLRCFGCCWPSSSVQQTLVRQARGCVVGRGFTQQLLQYAFLLMVLQRMMHVCVSQLLLEAVSVPKAWLRSGSFLVLTQRRTCSQAARNMLLERVAFGRDWKAVCSLRWCYIACGRREQRLHLCVAVVSVAAWCALTELPAAVSHGAAH
jgi:hypothetical protein